MSARNSKLSRGGRNPSLVAGVDPFQIAVLPRCLQVAVLALQEFAEPLVGVGLQGRVVEQHGHVDVRQFSDDPCVLPLINADKTSNQSKYRRYQAGTAKPRPHTAFAVRER